MAPNSHQLKQYIGGLLPNFHWHFQLFYSQAWILKPGSHSLTKSQIYHSKSLQVQCKFVSLCCALQDDSCMKSMRMLTRKIRIKHLIKRGQCAHESGIINFIEPMEETAKYSQPISPSLQPFVSSSVERCVNMTTHTQKYGCLGD